MAQEENDQDVDLNNDETDTGSDEDTDTSKEGDEGDKGPKRPAETDEARLTRLTRQTNQQRKKMGLDPLTERQVAQQTDKKQETKEPSDALDNGQKALLRSMGIKGQDELQLAKDFMKRTGQDIDSLESDDIFQGKLDKLRTTKANEIAASAGKGRGNTGSATTVEAVLAKLGPNDPVPADLPRDIREKVVAARIKQGENAKVFYND